MYLFVIITMVIVAVLMCLIVLIQNSKGGGLSSSFSASNAIMGVRKTTDFLEKATWTFAISMLVLSVAAAYTLPSRQVKEQDAVLKQAIESQKLNPTMLPQGGEAPVVEQPQSTETTSAEAPATTETPAEQQ